MPTYRTKNRTTGDQTEAYSFSYHTTEGGERLLTRRKEVIAARDEMLRLQKEFGKRDPDTARFFKAEATHWLKHYRALTYIISHFILDPPGDCKVTQTGQPIEPWYFPLDLADELDYYGHLIKAGLI